MISYLEVMKQIKYLTKYIALLSVPIYFIFKYWYCPEIFPDLLGLSLVSPSNYFELLINGTASIFGVLIAVILLTFEFLKHNSFRKQGENVLNKGVVTNLVSIAVAVIILSLISYINIQDFKQSNNLTLGYFLGFLFMVFIISIFPATKGILESANTLKKVKNEIKSLTIENFNEILTIQNDRFISKDSAIKLIGIRQELINSVRECDFEAYTSILEELNNRAFELIGKGDNRRITDIVLRGITFIWNAGNFEALRVGNYQFYETIWECVDEIHEYAAKKKNHLLFYSSLNLFNREFINFLSRNKLGDSLSSGIKTLANAFKQNLKHNCPPQEQVIDLYFMFEPGKKPTQNSDGSIQWDDIVEFISLMNQIQIIAIDNQDKELYDTCRLEFEYIVKEIHYNEFPNVENYQEAFIIINIFRYQTHNAYLALDKNLFNGSAWTFTIDTKLISNLVKAEEFYLKRILQDISDFLIKSQRAERLDDFHSLLYWGALGRHISSFYLKNKTAQKTMDYVFDTLETLKREIELKQLPNQARNYIEIKKQCESIKSMLLGYYEENDIPILKRIDKILSEFKEVANEENDYGIVKWKED